MDELGSFIQPIAQPYADETVDEWVARGGLQQLEKKLYSEERTPTGEYKNWFDKQHYYKFEGYKQTPTKEKLQELFDHLKKGQPREGIPVA